MATLESINRLLSVGATLLDHAAAEIRDAKLEPVRRTLKALARLWPKSFEIQYQIYELKPDLKPEYLKQSSEHSVANRLLTEYMYNASGFELAGNHERAIAIFQEFLALESSPLHRDIAAGEIEKLRDASGT